MTDTKGTIDLKAHLYPELLLNVHGALVRLGGKDGHAWLEITHKHGLRANVFLTSETVDELEMAIAELRRDEERRQACREEPVAEPF